MENGKQQGNGLNHGHPKEISQVCRLPIQRKREQHQDDYKNGVSSKDLRLRQNYIINRDMVYTSMQGQFNEIASKPDFNRFISLKKSPQPKNDIIAKQIVRSHEEKRRQNPNRNRLRQRILFQKMRRPQHNSPMKITVKQTDTQSTLHTDLLSSPKHHHKTVNSFQQVDQNDNSMMIKQLVTHLGDSRKKLMPSDPYTSRSRHKYYVAEAVKDYKDRQSAVRDHLFNSIYFLELLASYDNTTKYGQDKPISLGLDPNFKDKITVVFDLDETLVHCFEQLSQKHEVEIPVTFPGGHSMIAPVNIRPHARQILKALGPQFQLIVFTASHQAYANAVINYLDPTKQLIKHRLFRRHCDYIQEGYYVKDLRILGRNLARTVIVDNAAYSYAFQVSNGIPIISYYEGEKDYELLALRDYLFSLQKYKDVRECNENTFKLKEYVRYTTVQELVEELYIE